MDRPIDRALTVRQPWAWAIAAGLKALENRSWRPPAELLGQRIAIHAGTGPDREGERWCAAHGIEVPAELPRGELVAVARIVGVVEESDDLWWRGPLAWRLADVRPVPRGIRLRGALGLWRLPPGLPL
jgi:hypothetical protein